MKRIKEAILIAMAHICYKHLERKIEEEHEGHMQEIIDYIKLREEHGLVINIIANEEFLGSKFALQSEPLPEISHLTVVDEDEEIK
jgi:hypothetical protein